MYEQVRHETAVKIKQAIGRILSNYEKEGISQNLLIDILIRDKICVRRTFYKHKKELLQSGIMRFEKGKKYPKIFPTMKGQKLTEFSEVIQTIERLLYLIKQNPEVGDCFLESEVKKIPGLKNSRNDDLSRRDKFIETIYVDESTGPNGRIYSLQARYNILKILPAFLIIFINQIKKDSKKDELFNIANPIIDECYKEIQDSYTDSIYYASSYRKKIKSNVDIYFIVGLPVHDIKAEFLRNIGRFYFLISLAFSKDLKSESPEQDIISNFVEKFYSKTEIYDDEVSKKIEDGEITSFIADESIAKKHMNKDKFSKLREIKNSFAGQFAIKRDNSHDDDPYLISDFYDDWIFNPSMKIFSGIERRFIEAWVKYNEDYDQEAPYLDHNNPSEMKKRPIKGSLIQNSSGKAIIALKEEYKQVKPWMGRVVQVQLDNIRGY